jgi:WD40 repeat protein
MLSSHWDYVFAVAFDPLNNDILASGSGDMTIKFWNTTTSSVLRNIYGDSAVYSLAYHNNNKRLLASSSFDSSSGDNLIKIWNTITYALVATLTGHIGLVNSLAFDPSRPGIMASGSDDKIIKIWDLNVASPALVTTITNHGWKVLVVTFETTGLMASGDEGRRIIIWETNRTLKFVIDSGSDGLIPVRSLAFSPLMDNRLLASGHGNNLIKLWNPSTGVQVGTLTGHGNTVASLAFNQTGLLASGSWDNTIKLWNVTTGAVSKTLSGHTGWVTSVAFRSDGPLASGSYDRNVRIWSGF